MHAILSSSFVSADWLSKRAFHKVLSDIFYLCCYQDETASNPWALQKSIKVDRKDYFPL